MRKTAILLATMGILVALFAGVALAKVVNGGPGEDTLVGTNSADTIRGYGDEDDIYGRGGGDTLVGGGYGYDLIKAIDRSATAATTT